MQWDQFQRKEAEHHLIWSNMFSQQWLNVHSHITSLVKDSGNLRQYATMLLILEAEYLPLLRIASSVNHFPCVSVSLLSMRSFTRRHLATKSVCGPMKARRASNPWVHGTWLNNCWIFGSMFISTWWMIQSNDFRTAYYDINSHCNCI